MQPRNNYSASLFRDAVRADLQHSPYEGRHSRYEARHVARKPSKWKWVAAAAAAAGGIAAVATAAPWSGGSASLTADQRVTTTRHSTAFSSALTNMAKSAAADAVNSRADVAGKSQGAASGSKAAAPASPKAARPATAPAHSAAKASAPAAAKPAVVNSGKAVHAAQKQAAPAHTATAQQGGVKSSKSSQSSQSQSTQSTQATPTTFYDSVEPGYIPGGAAVATYADGPYAQSAASLAGRGTIMWIDVSGGDPNADALDIEPTDATPAVAAAWVDTKLTQDPSSYPILYTSYSEWSEVKADVAQLPSWMASHVKYWIADPTGYPHILAGASATQWYWGATYDISSAVPGFFP